MPQRDPWHLCSARTQVGSLVWHSGLKDPVLPWLRRRLQLVALIWPWPWNSICCRKAKKKKKLAYLDACGWINGLNKAREIHIMRHYSALKRKDNMDKF